MSGHYSIASSLWATNATVSAVHSRNMERGLVSSILVVRILRLVPARAHQTARRMGITAGLKRMVCTTSRPARVTGGDGPSVVRRPKEKNRG